MPAPRLGMAPNRIVILSLDSDVTKHEFGRVGPVDQAHVYSAKVVWAEINASTPIVCRNTVCISCRCRRGRDRCAWVCCRSGSVPPAAAATVRPCQATGPCVVSRVPADLQSAFQRRRLFWPCRLVLRSNPVQRAGSVMLRFHPASRRRKTSTGIIPYSRP